MTDDGIGVIPKEWDNEENAYKLRAVSKGLGKLNVKTNTDHVEVRGSKKDGNVILHYGDASPSTEPFLKWGDGLFSSGTTVVGDEAEAPEVEPIHLYIPSVRSRAAMPQISVTDEGAGDTKVYEVKGNGVDATYSLSINGGSQQPLVESKDGLVTNASKNINITIPDPPAGTVIPAAPSITSGQIAILTGEGEDLAWIIATVTAVDICGGSINVLTVP